MCGQNSDSADPVEPVAECGVSNLVRWGCGRNQDGSVDGCNNCWYCERAFKSHFEHKYTRADLKKEMAKDKSVQEKFHAVRADIIARREGGAKRVAADRKVEVRTTKDRSQRFIKPRDKFWPLAAYIKAFGDPKSKDNKRNGHKVCWAHGTKGVLVPNKEAEDGPWEVETSFGNTIQLEETETARKHQHVVNGAVDANLASPQA